MTCHNSHNCSELGLKNKNQLSTTHGAPRKHKENNPENNKGSKPKKCWTLRVMTEKNHSNLDLKILVDEMQRHRSQMASLLLGMIKLSAVRNC